MCIKDFLESKETYKKVLEILSHHFDGSLSYATSNVVTSENETIEIDGFIAGGSVSNILYYLLYGVKPVVNDIDIFFHKKTRKPIFTKKNSETKLEKITSNVVDVGWYGSNRSENSFKIYGHKREGILNYVHTCIFSEDKSYTVFLDNFDLNCCKSGLDIKNEKIVYTEDFVEFLKSRQIEISKVINPIQTTIRIKNKVKDLDCYCDIDSEISLLQHASIYHHKIGIQIGEETYAKYLNNKDFVDKYFTIKELDYSKISFNSPFTVINGESWIFEPKLNGYIVPFWFNNVNQLYVYWRLFKSNLSRSKKSKIDKIMSYIYSNGFSKLNTFDSKVFVTERLLGNSVAYKNYTKQGLNYYMGIKDIKVHQINSTIWKFLISNNRYYDCDFDIRHLKLIEKFSREHLNLFRIFNGFNGDITVQSQYEIIKYIKSMSKKKGLWIIGELENVGQNNKYKIKGNSVIELVKSIDTYIEHREEDLSKKLIEKIDLSGFEFSDNVTELTTTIELIEEGKKMGHCVGGYSLSVEKGNSRIFHIEEGGHGSTVEISNNNGDRWWNFNGEVKKDIPKQWELFGDKDLIHKWQKINEKITNSEFKSIQHYGRYPEKGNLTPTKEHINIVRCLVNYLNKNHLKGNIEDLLFDKFILEKEIEKTIEEVKEKERLKLESVN